MRDTTQSSARASCSCLATDRLPISIPPAGSIELHISIHLETSTTGTVEQSVHYRTDLPAVPEFVAVVVGHVSKG
ncbi:MAG: hypothetical protein SFX72_07865 [Isosphaeraceae bacterium]|nr:hypothetical protein [Isosphaeraceae bacterium]